MAKRQSEDAGLAGPAIPPPPLQLRIHKNAPPHDGRYRRLNERLEVVGRFRRAALDLPGVASAAAYADSAAADLGVKSVRLGELVLMRTVWDGLVIWFWVSIPTSTVYLLHAIPETLFGRIPSSADQIAAVRCAEVQRLDASRAAGGTDPTGSSQAGRPLKTDATGRRTPDHGDTR